MEINGQELSEAIRDKIKQEVENLKQKGIVPKLAIITLGPEDSWKAYVGQKIKFADQFGIEKELINLRDGRKLYDEVDRLNNEPDINGIIVQRPLPVSIDRVRLNRLISPQKDIDGFRADSIHEVPVWQAARRILEEAMLLSAHPGTNSTHIKLEHFLSTKTIVIIGKGESAGKFIIEGIAKLGISPIVIDSKTEDRSKILKNADIVISAVGKKVIIPTDLKKGVILVGVGIHRNDNGKLCGDYDEREIKDIASFYTPTPGGIGPLNLAYLFLNLLAAA